MPTETQHLEQRVAALQSDLNARDQALDDAATENNEREPSRRDWFDEAQRLQADLTSANADKEAYAQNAIDLRADVERQRRLKMLVAEKLQNALNNCSVYRVQLAEQGALLQQGLEMINRGIVSFDDQVEYRQKLAALSASAEPVQQADAGLIDRLRKIATGEMAHNRNGECPDSIAGHGSRDIDCLACRALMTADRLLASAEPSSQVERDDRAEFEQAFVVQEGVFFSKERNEYRSMNGRSIEYTDAADLNLRLSGSRHPGSEAVWPGFSDWAQRC